MAGRKKERLDILLVKRKLAPSREKAKALIMTGIVYVEGQKEDKAGSFFESTAVIEIRGEKPRYVSRGGYKLEKAIEEFGLVLKGKICMDIGASTGGFTDCMLQNDAAKVYAVDVGYGQFDWNLRNDSRVVCMEKTNIRYVEKETIGESLDFISADVSFISLSKVFPVIYKLLNINGEAVVLIKPQFEAGREKVGKKGVVREKSVHSAVIRNICKYARENHMEILALTYSPIKGPEGNIEYLAHIKKENGDIQHQESKGDVPAKAFDDIIESIVKEAHAVLSA